MFKRNKTSHDNKYKKQKSSPKSSSKSSSHTTHNTSILRKFLTLRKKNTQIPDQLSDLSETSELLPQQIEIQKEPKGRKSEEFYRQPNNELKEAYNEFVSKKKMNRYSCSFEPEWSINDVYTDKQSNTNDINELDNNSSENHDMSELVEKYTRKEKSKVISSKTVFEYETKLNYCHLCMKKVDTNCIVLSCNHVYHIPCLAKSQMNFNYLHEHTQEKKCSVCGKYMENAEILFLHTKYFNTIKTNIDEQDKKIKHLEEDMNQLKLEYKRSLDIRQKLEYSREQSKKIMIYFSTMSNFT